ncbi:MAG TPA: response regulator [Bacteroidota bacterium]|jgi:DNA-binding response OmpR family regulator|nr:response regulator [Bacteroidota bacterium]
MKKSDADSGHDNAVINHDAPRILIAEDEILVSWALARSLGEIGFEVSVVDSGAKALEKLHLTKFDVVITDLRLPEIDGFTLASEVKCLSPTVPVILLSTIDERSLEERKERVLIDAFVEKPFDLKEMIAVVRRFVDERQSKAEPGKCR